MNHCYKSLGIHCEQCSYTDIYINFFMDNEIAVWKLDRLFGTSSGTNRTLFHYWSMMQHIEMMKIMSFVIWPDEILQGGHRVDDPQHVTSSSCSTRKCGEIITLTWLNGNISIHSVKKHAWTNLSNGRYLKNESGIMMPR